MKQFSFLFVIFALLFSIPANAEVWKYEKTSGLSGCGRDAGSGTCMCNTNVARFTHQLGIYDSVSQRLKWEIDFKPGVFFPTLDPVTCQPTSAETTSNMTAQGMFLVLNNGPMPSDASEGQYAILYMDWIDINNPRITVYSYNGNAFVAPGEPGWFMKEKSYIDGSIASGLQVPDRILSNMTPAGSATNPTGWIQDVSVTETGSGQERVLKMRLNLDVSFLNAHTPLYGTSSSWEGMRFGGTNPPKIGYWNQFRFFGSEEPNIQYSDGWLEEWRPTGSGASWLDNNSATAVSTTPKCEAFPTSPISVFANETVSFSEIFINDTDATTINFSYSGAPNGMVINPAPGTYQGNSIEINGSWLTSSADVAASPYTVVFSGTDQYDAAVSCPLVIEVKENQQPIIEIPSNASYTSLSCLGTRTSVNLNWTAVDPDNYPLQQLILNWTTNCPNTVITNSNTANATIEFDPVTNGLPSACTATLTAFDGEKTTRFTSPVSVANCLRDCAGNINGVTTFDVCGACGGNGSSCLDCKGVPFGVAKNDACGVCGGNGTSCVKCTNINIASSQFILDSTAFDQAKLIERISNKIINSKLSSRSSIKRAKSLLAKSKSIYAAQWSSIWSLSSTQSSCESNAACATSDNSSVISSFSTGNTGLSNTTESLLRIARSDRSVGSKQIAQFRKTSKRYVNQNVKEIAKLPLSQSLCS